MSEDRRDSSPLLTATRLWERTSGKGKRYLAGRLGNLRVLVMEARDRRGPDDATHVLLVTEATPRDGGEA